MDLQNRFSWSRSRDGLFHDCRRKYFYHYYGSWGGWEGDAQEEIRRLYVLKQLQSRQMWVGKLVHEGVEWVLRALRAGQEVSAEGLVGEIIQRMRREWKASKAREYQDRPKDGGLFEHEYGTAIADSEWRALRDLVMRCLRNFFRLDLLAEIRRIPREQWVLLEEIRAFEFEGTPIFAAPEAFPGAVELKKSQFEEGAPEDFAGGLLASGRMSADTPPSGRAAACGLGAWTAASSWPFWFRPRR